MVRGTGEDSDDLLVICPDRDLLVGQGDVAAVLGTAADFENHQVDLRVHADRARRPAPDPCAGTVDGGAVGPAEGLRPGVLPGVDARCSALLSVSTLLLWLTYDRPGMSLLDALYFSTETVATVGYGDFNFIDQSPWLRMWAIFLMAAGVTTIAMMMAFLSDMLISRRLNDSTGRRRVRGMSRHVVVIGLGAFGIRVASALVDAGKRVVIIERDRENRFLPEAQELKLPVIFGDATQRSTLDAARLAQSSAVAIMTSNDMVNIETAIAVHDLIRLSDGDVRLGAGDHQGLRPGPRQDNGAAIRLRATCSPPRSSRRRGSSARRWGWMFLARSPSPSGRSWSAG